MKFALFSDVHANLPALEVVLPHIEEQNAAFVYCLGDLVGYAPWPNEVVELVRAKNIPTITGNYDQGVGLHSDDCGCAYKTDEDRERGAQSISWTNANISEENRLWLRDLEGHFRKTYAESGFSILMVHGSPRRINEYLFEDRSDQSFLRIMEEADADVMLFGHTHKPFHKVIVTEEEDGKKRFRHAINIGSVGKPKDGDPRACYAIMDVKTDPSPYDPDSIQVEFVRLTYDVERAATEIEKSELPDEFAGMLRTGT